MCVCNLPSKIYYGGKIAISCAAREEGSPYALRKSYLLRVHTRLSKSRETAERAIGSVIDVAEGPVARQFVRPRSDVLIGGICKPGNTVRLPLES